MTFTELAQEVLNRCGEGFQDYIERAGEHLKKNIEDLINNGAMGEADYPGLIVEYLDAYSVTIPLSSFFGSESYQLLKIMSVLVDDVKIDLISNAEYDVSAKLGSLFSKGYIYRSGEIQFVGIVSASGVRIRLVKRFVPATTEEDMLNSFTLRFIDALTDLTVQTLYKEINS